MDTEMWNILLSAVPNIGFPAVIVFILLFRLERTLRDMAEKEAQALERLREAIVDNTLLLREIAVLIRDVERKER